jgi:hypothetical protein
METFEHQTGRTGGLTLALYMKDETERDIVKMLVVLRRTKRYLSLFAVYIIQRAPIDWENIGIYVKEFSIMGSNYNYQFNFFIDKTPRAVVKNFLGLHLIC